MMCGWASYPTAPTSNSFPVGQHASMIRNHFYVNVPLDGNVFKVNKKQQKKSVQSKSSAVQSKCKKRKLPQTIESTFLSPPTKRKNENKNKNITENATKEVPLTMRPTTTTQTLLNMKPTGTTTTQAPSTMKPTTEAPLPTKPTTTTQPPSAMKPTTTTHDKYLKP